jgi:hypothetical protein
MTRLKKLFNFFSVKIILFFLVCISIIIPDKAHSLDITAGATTWYAWGNSNEDIMTDTAGNSSRYGTNTNYSLDPAFLYGPALSIKFNNDFNLTFVYLYGQLEHKTIYLDNVILGNNVEAIYKFKRNDSDTALNYRLNDYFKVFAGIKYMRYDIKLRADTRPNFADSYSCNSKHISFGPGLGLSSTLPLTENIFLLGTLSGFYLFSLGEKFEDNGIYNSFSISAQKNYKMGYKEYGMNSTLAIAYYIAPVSTVISLGGRFQYFKTDYEKKWNDSGNNNFYINSITNKMYGITLTATYSFSI